MKYRTAAAIILIILLLSLCSCAAAKTFIYTEPETGIEVTLPESFSLQDETDGALFVSPDGLNTAAIWSEPYSETTVDGLYSLFSINTDFVTYSDETGIICDKSSESGVIYRYFISGGRLVYVISVGDPLSDNYADCSAISVAADK